MKYLEIMLWVVGATLLTLFVGAQTWGEIERQRDVTNFTHAAFTQARQLASATELIPAKQPVIHPMVGFVPVTEKTSAPSPDNAVLAILRIPRIALEVPVNYGTSEGVLLRGAGLVEGTARPGSDGNVAIAAHRDTHFRALKNLTLGDRVELEMLDHTQTYIVTGLTVVEPTDVYVLADTSKPVLTLVTCYPFYFVGHAPQRFIVRAEASGFSI
jgi:sortase A